MHNIALEVIHQELDSLDNILFGIDINEILNYRWKDFSILNLRPADTVFVGLILNLRINKPNQKKHADEIEQACVRRTQLHLIQAWVRRERLRGLLSGYKNDQI